MRCSACDSSISEKALADRMLCGEYWDLCKHCQDEAISINPIYNHRFDATMDGRVGTTHLFEERVQRRSPGRERVYITQETTNLWLGLFAMQAADAEAPMAEPYTTMAAGIASSAASRAGASEALSRYQKRTGPEA